MLIVFKVSIGYSEYPSMMTRSQLSHRKNLIKFVYDFSDFLLALNSNLKKITTLY